MKDDKPHVEYGLNVPPEEERFVTVLSIFLLVGLFLYLGYVSWFREPIPHDIIVYNHTGNVITASNRLGAEHIIQNNSSAVLPANQGSRDHTATPTLLVVTAKRIAWSYRTDYPPREYLTGGDNGRRACGYQIEADGVIYAIKPDTDKPVDALPPQPPGFPLIPSPH